MKKILLIIVSVFMMSASFASVIPAAEIPVNAYSVQVPAGKSGNSISLMALSSISVTEYEKLSGKEMKFFQKTAFKKAQRMLKKNISADGTINRKDVEKFARFSYGEGGFHLGGFLLGLFLGPIGVLLTYIAWNDDYKSDRRKWAWYGFGIAVSLLLILARLVAQPE
jgi:hypothetical protein